MKKDSHLKKLALLGITGGVLLTAQSLSASVVSENMTNPEVSSTIVANCGGGGCGAYKPHQPTREIGLATPSNYYYQGKSQTGQQQLEEGQSTNGNDEWQDAQGNGAKKNNKKNRSGWWWGNDSEDGGNGRGGQIKGKKGYYSQNQGQMSGYQGHPNQGFQGQPHGVQGGCPATQGRPYFYQGGSSQQPYYQQGRMQQGRMQQGHMQQGSQNGSQQGSWWGTEGENGNGDRMIQQNGGMMDENDLNNNNPQTFGPYQAPTTYYPQEQYYYQAEQSYYPDSAYSKKRLRIR